MMNALSGLHILPPSSGAAVPAHVVQPLTSEDTTEMVMFHPSPSIHTNPISLRRTCSPLHQHNLGYSDILYPGRMFEDMFFPILQLIIC